MKWINLMFACILATASCTGTTVNNNATQQPQEQNTASNHNKLTEQYISQRLTNIFNEALNEDDHDLLALDRKFMSLEYNRLQDKAMQIAERIDDLVIDSDHWIQGQDWTYATMRIVSIEDITATTALARVNIIPHIPGSDNVITLLILPLVFERGDWYIDNMQQYYEGELLDEKAWYKKYVDSDGKMDNN